MSNARRTSFVRPWLWSLALAVAATPNASFGQTIVRTLGASDDRGVPAVVASEANWQAPIPPLVEGRAIEVAKDTHCYAGAHPYTLAADAPDDAPRWHDQTQPHNHPEPPLDLRLFAFDNRCYHFTGDPTDFGHFKNLYAFFGMHPIAASVGGGWCYQDGSHNHAYRVPSPYMQRIANRYFWSGGFDAEFRVYYPYFVHFFRELYPLFYSRGRYAASRRVAPPLRYVPLPAEMLSWGPPPTPEPQRQAAPPPPPSQPAVPPGTTVIVQQPAAGFVGYNQLWGAPFADWGVHNFPARNNRQPAAPSPQLSPSPSPPPVAAPPSPPAPPRYSGQTIVR